MWLGYQFRDSLLAGAETNHPAYYVVDISGGPDASSYPLSAGDSLPEDFNTNTCRSGRIILKWIEPNTFAMGQAGIATPTNEVTFSEGFYAGIFEITQAQWENVMGPSTFHFDDRSDHPAEMVSWEDIRGDSSVHDWPTVKTVAEDSFMGRLSARTDARFRFDLPTEAQWECACRAGTTTLWSFGDSKEPIGDSAWYRRNALKRTHQVGTKQQNAWGFFDLHGNVWEWCLDRYGSYTPGAKTDPTGATEGWYRVWRGGGWDVGEPLLRSAHRHGGLPSSRGSHAGFRVVMSIP